MTDRGFSITEVVVASRDVSAAAERFGKALDVPPMSLWLIPQSGIEIEMTGVWVGDFRLAFVQDATGGAPVSRFLERRGEGLFEICLRTNDPRAAMERMAAAGIRFTSDEPHVLIDYEWRGEVFAEVPSRWRVLRQPARLPRDDGAPVGLHHLHCVGRSHVWQSGSGYLRDGHGRDFGLLSVLKLEAERHGIRVNSVAPMAQTRVPRARSFPSTRTSALARSIPTSLPGRPLLRL